MTTMRSCQSPHVARGKVGHFFKNPQNCNLNNGTTVGPIELKLGTQLGLHQIIHLHVLRLGCDCTCARARQRCSRSRERLDQLRYNLVEGCMPKREILMHRICRNAPHLSTCAIFVAYRPNIKNPNLRICSAPQKRCHRPNRRLGFFNSKITIR